MTQALRGTVARARAALAPPTDGQLVGRFVADRDDDAFALLVARHGPMVFGVCRRVLGDHHLAEDAFQAVFLVLARRAAAVRPAEAVGNFLYGVAHRTALDARRRVPRERTGDVPEVGVEPAEPDDGRFVLDEELVRLPAKYRELLVACDLEGRPRREVAAAFGLVEGTLSSRLTTARRMLAGRLRKRGVFAVPAGLAVAVPPRVLAAAARIGRATAGAVPAVGALGLRVARVMTHVLKLSALAAVLVVAASLWGASDPPAPKAAPAVKAAPREPVFLAWRRGHPALFALDGKVVKELPNGTFGDKVGAAQLSPDGKRMAYSVEVEIVRPPSAHGGQYRQQVYLRDLDDPEAGTDLGLDGQLVLWSRDGRRLYGQTRDWDKVRAGTDTLSDGISWVYDLTTKTRTVLDLPGTWYVADESPDGKQILATDIFFDGAPKVRTYLTSLDGKTRTLLLDTDCEYRGAKFSPDGTKILLANHTFKNGGPAIDHKLAVYDVATKAVRVLKIEGLPKFHFLAGVGAYAWHPDGKRILFAWHEMIDPALMPKGMLPGIPPPGKNPPNVPPPVVPPPADPNKPPPKVNLPPGGRFPQSVSIVNADGTGMKVLLTDKTHGYNQIDLR